MEKRKKRRVFSQDFKKQVVELYKAGKPRKDIIADYDLTPSAFDKWVRQYDEPDNAELDEGLTPEQRVIRQLRKENAQLKLENEILKQAALIFGRMEK